MLKVVNLTKVYKSKKGAEVRALDGVSIQSPEKGMVFLLGKSESGKSTLLNVCGGLDSSTDGEVTVKGRSSKDFTQSDFDSYRNTLVGFIFQEYNILNEFTVEGNIALALELQGKPKDAATIARLLEEVDLADFAKRKPNTLSGGQKQRIAIARALVKAPEIIMADEPTGALDSKTGKQVFDTLKKLSADKLVVVVSHDRDFAEQYTDRIIELKDGKILSDVTKTETTSKALSGHVEALGEVLCVQGGSALSDADFDEIKAFLQRSKGDIVIAADPQNVDAVKKAVRINDVGERETFLPTNTGGIPNRTYSPEEGRFIRSKLPLRHAVKIGFAGLKSKPFRLVLTVLLCTVAFTIFGLLSTMSFYDSESTFRETMLTEDNTVIDGTVHSMSQIFLYVGLVMALFAILLFSNFISASILQKKKDIGILRAVGARSNDVFKIFFSESFLICILCIVLSTAGCVILCNVINAELSAGLGASLMVFGPLSLIVLVAIAVLTAILATFLPVNNATRKKPVESIRAL